MQPNNPYLNGSDQGDEYELLNLSMPNDKLLAMLADSLNRSQEHWNTHPWQLDTTDQQAMHYLFNSNRSPKDLVGQMLSETDNLPDNRLGVSLRAILSYACGRLANPEITPSSSDDQVVRQARDMQEALYQHSLDENVDAKVRAQVTNLITRKRGFLKLRFDETVGAKGDIVTDSVPPEYIVVDRYARYMDNPNVIHQRLSCSVDELCAKFPGQTKQIYQALGIQKGVYTQMARMITYYESHFSYLDKDYYPREGVAWWLLDSKLILDKQPNPNWIYTGDDAHDKQVNLLWRPPKPFININFLSLGKSYIDETCLFEQAIPEQERLDRRNRQWHKNIDYVNGRWIADGDILSDTEATKMVNRGPKTIGLLKGLSGKPVTSAFANVASQPLPKEVYESIIDSRNEIDVIMGTPSVFRGAQPERQDTLGRDQMVKQQAGALQDDLVRAVSTAMEHYYRVKLQMMRVYYNQDYTFQSKGADGKYRFITVNSENIDTGVKVGVQVDSTLPLDKQMIRSVAADLLKANKIDYLTAMQDLGLPDPEVRTERYLKSIMQPLVYAQSVDRGVENNEAEQDLQDVLNGREPAERDSYDQEYLDYYNMFLTTNRFAKLQPEQKQIVIAHLSMVQHIAQQQASLQEQMGGLDSTLDAAGMTSTVIPPSPKVNVSLKGEVPPDQAATLSGAPAPKAAPAPVQ